MQNSFVTLIATMAAAFPGLSDQAAPPSKTAEPVKAKAATANDHALHNVIKVTDKLISGGIPEGDEAFEELRSMGIKTIISVDGATPDIERAKSRGMRYVHIPVGYHGIDPDKERTLGLAIRDLPGPIYLHCHHGRHRGPAAAAAGAITAGLLTADEGTALLKKAGTSPDYKGLYSCVAKAVTLPKEELDKVAPDFPEIAPTPGFIKAMADMQNRYDHLVEVRDAGWKVPENHPDLVLLDEARQLEKMFQIAIEDPKSKEMPKDYAEMMQSGSTAAAALREAIEKNEPNEKLTSSLKVVGASCKECHVQYRDNKK